MPDDQDRYSSAELDALRAERDQLRRELGDATRARWQAEARLAARDCELLRTRARLEGRDPRLVMH